MTSTPTPPGRPARRSVFRMLLRSMIAFGLVVGLAFPPLAALVLDTRRALALDLFLMCVATGVLVGLINFVLFRVVVSRELARLATGMERIVDSVSQAVRGGTVDGNWQLEITSDDAVGEIESRFNDMADAIARRLDLEHLTRRLHTRLSSSVEMDQVASSLLQALLQVSGGQAGLLYGNVGGEFRLVHNIGIDHVDDLPAALDRRHGAVERALDSSAVLTLAPLEAEMPWLRHSSPLATFVPGSIVIVPVRSERQPVGVAALALPQRALDRQQSEHVELLRSQFAPYLKNALLHDRLHELAALDDLTGILNRRFGLRRLQEIAGQSFRHGTPFSVLLFDLDHFKRLNDAFGHDAGDAVLRRLASDLAGNVRSGDVACRYGGEEFMIVLAGTGFDDALRIAERIRRQTATREVAWRERGLTMTASIGVATWPMTRVSTPDELVTAADRALDAAKAAGRNRVFGLLDNEAVAANELRPDPEDVQG